MSDPSKAKFVVIGGGIAGVTCVETLSVLAEEASITLISASPLIKTVTNYTKLTHVAEMFDVETKPLEALRKKGQNVCVVHASVTSISVADKIVKTSDGQQLPYDKLCVCTGGQPRLIADGNPLILGIRDTESVQEFRDKIKTARRVMIVGNGGIATELVYELESCEVIWAIKDKSIAHTFVDAGAGQFFMEELNKPKDKTPGGPSKRIKYTTAESHSYAAHGSDVMGGALGPDWTRDLNICGRLTQVSHRVHVEKEVEVECFMTPSDFMQSDSEESKPWQDTAGTSTLEEHCWPIYVCLTNCKVYGCDLVVSATGVHPNSSILLTDGDKSKKFALSKDGGIQVNSRMETSEPSVFAAGDVCTACWEHSKHWLQMRLWSQARQMGCYTAKCMIADVNNEVISLDFCFEMFAHVTTFFKFKVVLLGLFNAQGLGNDHEVLLRMTKGEEYVKVILQDGRMVGAVLVGETDLEETFENLILNGLDLTPYKEHLLEPGIDIEDFFD